MDYKWNIQGKANNITEILQYITKERGFDNNQIKDFIKSSQKPHDPFLFNNMQEVVNLIKYHIKNNNRICIIGDYDCDGVTSTYTMYRGLKYLNADVIYRLPHRVKDGYGLKEPLVDYAIENNSKLIITVDNGVAAVSAVDYANKLNIDVIVTDHHEPQDVLPDCLIIDPKVNKEYPFDGLCGCGVAFKVLCALIPEFEKTSLYDHLLEIVAIGTVADAMNLVDENRTFVIEGLKRMNDTSSVGLKQLFELSKLSGKEITADNIGFLIGPNVNAAGRVDSPDAALNLFLADDEVDGKKFAKNLISLNEKRKELQKKAIDELDIDESNGCIIASIDGSYAGIGGIVAAKIVELYHKPSFVLHGHNEIVSGSGRTFGDFDIMSCIIKHPEIVEGGGGHKSACGVALKYERINQFQQACNYEFDNWLKNNPDGLTPTLFATCEIDFNLISMRLVSNINKLKPFGNGNLEPTFITKNVEIISSKVVGKNQNVIQLTASNGYIDYKCVGFESLKDKYLELDMPKKVDILYTIGLNEWPANNFNIQLTLKDIIISKG